jgi:hypothetical protein
MRPLGRTAAVRADWALAHTLFWRGRFEQAHTLLAAVRLNVITSAADAAFNHVDLALLIPAQLSWTLALLGEKTAALAQAERALAWTSVRPEPVQRAFAEHALSLLHSFLDSPEAALTWSRQAQASAAACALPELGDSAQLLEYWALSRLGQPTHEARAQTALAALRRLGPGHEARAFSLYAQALFHQSPAHASTQLDAALDLNARCGLHHWEARLQHCKSQSLDAAGQLDEASRFLLLAQETAQRQGARLFLDNITGIESRTSASPTME